MAQNISAADNAAATQTEPLTVALTTADIKGMALSASGGLVITKTDGAMLVIENFKDMAAQGAKIALADGDQIDAAALFATLSGGAVAATLDDTANPEIVIVGPQPATVLQFTLVPGQTYVLEFDPKSQETHLENGTLILTFANGGTVVLQNYEQAMFSTTPPVMKIAGGLVIDGIELLEWSRLAGKEDVRAEPEMAQLAEELAQVEPAAGETGAAGGRGGFGFQSSVDSAPLGSPAPVGPIGPTALQFGLPQFDGRVFAESDPAPQPPGTPGFETQDVFVKEDGTVQLLIVASSNGFANVDTTVTLSGIPAGWTVDPNGGTYDAATGTWTHDMPGGGTFSGGPLLSPPADSDVDLPNLVVTVTNTSTVNGLSSSQTGPVNVFVDAVADVPTLATQDAAGLEDAVLPVGITTAVTDVDGSESITRIEIANLPSGFTLSAGTYDAGTGIWTLTPAQLAGLSVTPPTGFHGAITLDVTTYNSESTLSGDEQDLTDNTNSNTGPLTLTWTPVVDTPDILVNGGVDDAQVLEDGTVNVTVVANLGVNASPNEILTVTVTGIDTTWGFSVPVGTYDAVAGTWTVTLPPGQNLSTVMTFTPPADSDIDMSGLVATATAFEPASGTSAQATDGFNIVTDAVADVPTLATQDAAGLENAVLPVGITTAVTDVDGSESITRIEIANLPSGFTLSAGTYDAGTGIWTLTPAQLAGLSVTPPTGFNGTITLDVTTFNAETNKSDTDFDLGNDTNSNNDALVLTWKPVVDTPDILVNGGVDDARVKEDGSVDVPIVANLGADAAPSEVLTVTVTGIDAAWGFSAPVGTYDAVSGTWTVTLPAGQNLSTVMTFTPPADSDIDMSGLVATATAFEPASGTSAQATDGFNIVTDAVIDTPILTASSPGGEEDRAIDLNIATSVTDLDGSEAITHLSVSGLPTGASLNQGTDLGGGVWQLTPAQLTGLKLNPPTGFSGTLNLSVTTYASEVSLSGSEYDLTDNDTSVTVPLAVTVAPDDVPQNFQPGTKTVDETDLAATGTVSVSHTMTANFGSDTPGVFGATGAFISAIPLTSNGVPVDVTLTGNTYTGVAGTDPIFTLQVNANGTYTFNLTGVIDHPDVTDTNESLALSFGVSATDSDGDAVTGNVVINVLDDAPKANDDINNFDLLDGGTDGNVISGLNADNIGAADLGSQDVPNKVTAVSFGTTTVSVPGTGDATIKGDHGTLTIKSDGSYTYVLDGSPTAPAQDYNVVMMLDVSGSMGSNTSATSKISLLANAVKNLMSDFHDYDNGTVTVHLVPFGTNAGAGVTFNVTDDSGFQNVLNYLNTLNGNGNTNYEAPLQSALDWINANTSPDVKTISYFVSDGQPNTYINASGNAVTGNLATVIGQLSGSDGSDEISMIKAASDEVIGVGINVTASALANIALIDSDGVALNVQNPQDLDAALAGSNPIGNQKPSTDVFTYTLTDADGDPSLATLTLNAEAPVILPPTITVNNNIDDVIVKEDGSVFVPIVATLDPAGPATQVLTVTVTGIDPTWTLTNTNGTYTPATGTWTITLPAGQNYNGGLTFAPPANSDLDLTGLNASAKATEPVTGQSAIVNDGFQIITDAVADKPTLNASAGTVEQGNPVSISLSSAVTDLDGSETITGYQISGVPAGFSFNQGTSLGGGVWTFTPAQVAGLQLSGPDSFSGNFNLTVRVNNAETSLGGAEVDLSDNTNFATKTLAISITPDDQPIVAQPAVKVVDETALVSGTVSTSGAVTANFGNDTPGSFSATGGFSAAIPLKSEGIPVLVTQTGNVYTGKAGTETIFTLTLESNGQYTFDLTGTLDHPDTANHNDAIRLQFGVRATDSDGDSANTTIRIDVLDDGVVAVDDAATVDMGIGFVTGNVLSNDTLSQDTPNAVSKVQFGTTVVDVPATGFATITGKDGVLKIAADGSYTYTLLPGAGMTTTMNTLVLRDAATGTEFTVNAVQTATGVEFTLQLVNGTGDLNGFFLDIGGDGGPIFSVGDSSNNMGGISNGFDYARVLGSVGGGDADVTQATFEIAGLSLADLDDAIIGIRATSVATEASLKLTGTVETETVVCGCADDQFVYTLRDSDGDTDTAKLDIQCAVPVFLVGENVDDAAGSTIPYRVGTGVGTMNGAGAGDILVGDVGGATIVNQVKDYNIVMMLDVSGSMGSKTDANSRISLLTKAVKNLMEDFSAYDNGTIKVKLITFATGITQTGEFTVTTDGGYNSVVSFLNNLTGNGWTNYEAPLQSAINWLQSSAPIPGAETISYFVSDGEPNHYVNNSGTATSGTLSQVMAQLNGTADGTNEIATIKALSDEVIGVGINIGSSTLANIAALDSDGVALNVRDPQDLDAALAATNPLNRPAAVGDDHLVGGDGNDIIFGDALFTDAVAASFGLTALPGSGWDVFARLEAGESPVKPDWTRADTLAYIRANAESLAVEATGDGGAARSGGHDRLEGGVGNDLIFGQEGNDLIIGGAGDDLLYGGSGADTFQYNAITDGFDTIGDFDVTEGDVLDLSALLGDVGFDPVNDAITNFVFATDTAQGTVIQIDLTGAGNAAGATSVVVLEGVHGVTLNDLLASGSLTTV